MERYQLAITILTEELMYTLPNNTDYSSIRSAVESEIRVAFSNIREEIYEDRNGL